MYLFCIYALRIMFQQLFERENKKNTNFLEVLEVLIFFSHHLLIHRHCRRRRYWVKRKGGKTALSFDSQ